MGIHYGKADFINYGKPSLLLDFARNKSLVDRITGNNLITFTRSSTGTYVGADGLIKTAAVNEPRFDHNPTTGESLGLLIEESRTNREIQSEDFSGWERHDCTVQKNGVVAPDGSTNATTVTRNSTAYGGLYVYRSGDSGLTVTNGQVCTISAFFKAGTTSIISLNIDVSGYGGYPAAGNIRVNLTNGSVASSLGDAVSVVPFPNGWYRLSVTATATSNGVLNYGFASTTPNEFPVGTDIYVWGFQVELGSFPTSYIPTSGSTVTRSADVGYITQANMQSWYNQTQGTIFSESSGYYGEGGVAYFGSNVEGWGLFSNPSGLANKGRSSYSPDRGSGYSPYTYNTFYNFKNAISINDSTNLTYSAVNGTADSISGSERSGPFTYPTGFGLAQSDVNSTGQVRHSIRLKRISYYPVGLNGIQLQQLTQ